MFQSPTTKSTETSRASRKAETPEPRRELHPVTPICELGLAAQLRGGRSNRGMSALQSAMGNQVVQRMTPVSRPVLQAKLTVNKPGDSYEQEADRISEQVMRMPDSAVPLASSSTPPALQRKCACAGTDHLCSECEGEAERGNKLQCKANSATADAAPASAPPIVHEVLRSPGEPLDTSTRAFFEPRFGRDFSHVRVHTGTQAAESARSVNALAYTVNHSVAFGAGSYAPHTTEGRRLLAHELAHVVQQGCGNPISVQRNPGDGSSLSPQEKIAKAAEELDRLQAVAKVKGKKLSSEDALAAYDAVHSVVLTATSSNDADVLERARDLKSRLNSIVHDTDAAKPPSFAPHPAASQDPMSPEDSSKAVIAQRGFDSGLNAQKVQEAQEEIKQKQGRLDQVEAKLKTLTGDTKANSTAVKSELENLQAERKRLQRDIDNAKTRIAVSKPTMIDADPEKLRAQKQDLEAQLKKPNITAAQQKKILTKINTLNEQIEGLTSGQGKVPASALQGGKLGTPDLSSQDSFDRLQSHEKTYVTVQVVGPDGKLRTSTFQAHNDPASDLHAEDVVMDQLKKMPKSVLDGATIIITGDQEVCGRCAPRLVEFAKEHGAIANVSGITTHSPKLTSQQKDSGDPATAKTTTAKISDPVAVEKMEKAQNASGAKDPDEHLKQTYKKTTIYPAAQDQSGGSTSGGGAGDDSSVASAGKAPPAKGVTTSTVSKPDSDPAVSDKPIKKPAGAKTHTDTKDSTSKTATTHDEPEHKPAPKKKQSDPYVDLPVHGGGGVRPGGAAIDVAKHAVNGAGTVFTAKLEQLVRENSHDKDLNSALDTVDKAVDVQSFVENPAQFTAQAIKSAMIQGVFDHFSAILAGEQQKFVNRFPEVATIHEDPLDQGISYESYEKMYNKARLDLRIPTERKVLLYALVLLGTNKDTPDAEIQRRIQIANQAVLNLPDIVAYARRYTDARQYYEFAIFSVSNKENVLLDQLAEVPSAFPAELRRRGTALSSAGKDLSDLSDKIMSSGLVVFEPVYAVATELEALGNGFSNLGTQFNEFADLAGHRKSDYEADLKKTDTKQKKITADYSSLF